MKIKYKYLIFSIAVLSVIIRMFFLHPTFSDENFYFNAAKVFISGSIPYKDFFFAHPSFQLFFFGLIFKIFGASFLVAKLIPLVFSTISFLLVFFVGKEIFDEKTAFVSAISFMIFPAFLSFSLIGYGIFFTMSLVLFSIFFYAKGKNLIAAIFFVSAFYFRYFAAPFILVFLILDKTKFRKFFLYALVLAALFFVVFYSVFGFEYLRDTVLFHLSSKIGFPNPLNKYYWEYNFPLVILAIVGIGYGFWKKKRNFILFAGFPLVVDILLLVTLRIPFYHYFMLSLPFYALSIGKLFTQANDKILKILIFGIIIFAVYNNVATIDYYLNPLHAKKYFEIADFIAKNTNSSDKIIGEPSVVSYVSFSKNIPVPLKYTDSFIQHIYFENPSSFIEILSKEKPKFFIETYYLDSWYYFNIPEVKNFVQTHYASVFNVTGIPNYYVYEIKS